jgi:hypothetical protein
VSAEDRNGNTVTVTPDGVASSSARPSPSIATRLIDRSITGPSGETFDAYSAGDLVSFTDAA